VTSGYDVRCSVIVQRNHAVLLVHRTRDGLDDWVLPGGTPRDGESVAACARRELLEETGLSANPSQVALVVESAPPGASRRLLDIVFLAAEPVLGRAHSQEQGLEPRFVTPGELSGLDLHPALAGHLHRLLDPGPRLHAPYVSNLWRQAESCVLVLPLLRRQRPSEWTVRRVRRTGRGARRPFLGRQPDLGVASSRRRSGATGGENSREVAGAAERSCAS
jgi:8-oxo-dGTP diphosphatase